MIPVKELISEPIIYSASWEDGGRKKYVYLKKNKLYQFSINNEDDYREYSITSVKDIGSIYSEISPFNKHCKVTLHIRNIATGSIHGCSFPYSEKGKKLAEELTLELSKVME